MSDLMLLGVLRMPLPPNPDATTMAQFVSRARQAADRIEADAAEIERLRNVLTEIAEEGDRWTHEGLVHIAAEALSVHP